MMFRSNPAQRMMGLRSLSRYNCYKNKPRLSSLFSSSAISPQQEARPLTVGILRENYDAWERRAPLGPSHVQDFLTRHPEAQVLVQPSCHRIFSNQDYQQAGAQIQEDLSQAQVILGVKRPQTLDAVPPHTTCLFFSHVIKGQPENMGLLQGLLNQHNQLMDYECIVQKESSSSKPRRLVAFGKYAGLAGMLDTWSLLGRRLLLQSYSTPFLNCPPSIYHPNLQHAKQMVQEMGDRLASDGLPADMEPLVFTMTGKGGKVHSGVREIFDLIPHEIVTVEDLPQVLEQTGTPQYKVYGVEPTKADMYQRDNGDAFDETHFRNHPQEYTSKFAETVAPYTHVLMNCVYWDHRFPRLLTKEDLLRLYESGNERLLVVSDISCDINGSMEFLDRSTTIDEPCYQYDPLVGKEVSKTVQDHGVTVMGVDILPSELPVESSNHFGDSVIGVLDELVAANTAQHGVHVAQLSPQLKNALITTSEGTLAENFGYLDQIMKHTPVQVDGKQNSMEIILEGHLFDSGLINQVLDILEMHQCSSEFKECQVHHVGKGEAPIKSTAVIKIAGSEKTDLEKVESKIKTLCEAIDKAEASYTRMETRQSRLARVESQDVKKVLLLGSGRVSMSVTDLLGRSEDRKILVASDNESQAREVAGFAKNGRHIGLDIGNDPKKLSELIKNSDLVISLLPVPMHPMVAELCIDNRKDMVTASYESDQMRSMEERAIDAGIIMLNEVGLDPGLDHMSAMKIIDDIHERGGTVTSFTSVCGGLPAPEAANNPLRYKFSWSPRGVISASQNAATYRWEDHLVQVDGTELLQSAAPFLDAWKDLHLESLPNRNSLHYEGIYGLESARTIFRGTLRYRGFSSLMNIFKNMGFYENLPIGDAKTWAEVLDLLSRNRGGFDGLEDFLLACSEDNQDEAIRARECLQWLGMTGNSEIKKQNIPVIDLFCDQLEEKLEFKDSERDMVLMHHAISADFDDGTSEEHNSSLQAFGDRSMSAMCKTVGYTTAASAGLVLDGGLKGRTGLVLPTTKDIYIPCLEAVQREGIVFQETSKILPSSQHKVV